MTTQHILQSIVLPSKVAATISAGGPMRDRVDPGSGQHAVREYALIRALTCLMFLTFAMTTDAVGSVIPRIIEEFRLSMKAAGAFHYAPMSAIAAGALLLGFLADRLGRKRTIM